MFKADLRDEGSGGRSLLGSTFYLKPAEKFVDFPIVPRSRQIGYDTKGKLIGNLTLAPKSPQLGITALFLVK